MNYDQGGMVGTRVAMFTFVSEVLKFSIIFVSGERAVLI